jgi:soluble lytic murein transglycosylase-like protein
MLSAVVAVAGACVASPRESRPRSDLVPSHPAPTTTHAPGSPTGLASGPSSTGAPTTPAPSPQASRGTAFAPSPDRPLPAGAGALAAALARITSGLRTSTSKWLADGDPTTRRPPRDLVLEALYEQRLYRDLMRNPALAKAVLARLPANVRTRARLTTEAMATLIAGVRPLPSAAGFRTGPPEPPGALLADFHEAGRRFGVPWEVLAAVMYVESKFGRARSDSTAGAQGPMQFLPSTWVAYGLGGNIDDPHDAILGAANFLHANGAPGDVRRALFAYNHSDRYVNAVLLLAERLRLEPASFTALYAWQVFVVTVHGDVRITGPGTGAS